MEQPQLMACVQSSYELSSDAHRQQQLSADCSVGPALIASFKTPAMGALALMSCISITFTWIHSNSNSGSCQAMAADTPPVVAQPRLHFFAVLG